MLKTDLGGPSDNFAGHLDFSAKETTDSRDRFLSPYPRHSRALVRG